MPPKAKQTTGKPPEVFDDSAPRCVKCTHPKTRHFKGWQHRSPGACMCINCECRNFVELIAGGDGKS